MRLKLFLISFLASLSFWLFVNLSYQQLENFYLTKKISQASLSSNLLYQIKTKKINELKKLKLAKISAESAISVYFSKNGKEIVIYKKNPNKKLHIASLTKLVSTIVAKEFYKKSEQIVITKESVLQAGAQGFFRVGDKFLLEDLLKSALIESSNDAIFAIAQKIGEDNFVALMNLKIKSIGAKDSYFVNPTGLQESKNGGNYSTVKDLVKIGKYLIKNHPELIKILSLKKAPIYLANGKFHHLAKNTNLLLNKYPQIIAGKTGWTSLAGGCLLEILKVKNGFLVAVLLNSKKRFDDMEKILNYSLEYVKNSIN